MANTTNFGWETPDDTDLVKDGAAAMRTLGNAIDASFVDLKGGTTGQVLSKTSNTDLDFTWVTTDDTNAIQNAIVDAKGDLIAASAADTPARLAVGSNGETLVADSAATTGLRWQGNYSAGKNKVINGDFGIWQRGTSFTATSYTADRWYFIRLNTTTLSQQTFTPATAPVSGYEGTYFCRLARTSGSSDDYLIQRIEDVRTFAGQTATLSFWAKADTATTISEVYLEQNFGSGGSTAVGAGSTSVAITTSWARYSITISVPSISGKTIGSSNFLGITFKLASAMGNRTVDFWGIQLEAGSVATAFQTATGTIQGELAACQRYYFRTSYTNQNQANARHGIGGFASATVAYCFVQHPVPMRVSATSVDYSTLALYDYGTDRAVTGVTIQGDCNNQFGTLLNCTVASGGTQYRPVQLSNFGSGSGYVGLNAEL